ncbi:MAG TPA: hypothetical protein VGN08_08595 [Solirubrobacteraceae bacterium]
MIASRQHLVAALLAPAVIAVAGCGRGSSASRSQTAGKAAPSKPSPGHSAQSKRSRAQLAADRALGRQALLRLADFPAGWTASARHAERSHPKLEQEVAACLHVARAAVEESNPAEVRSPDFKHAGGADISSSVTVTQTPAEAAEQFAVFAKPETARCLRDGVEKELRFTLSHGTSSRTLPRGVSFGRATVEPMSFPAVGDQSVAYRVGVSIAARTVHLPLYFDAVLVRAGRAELSLSFAGVLLPTSPSTEVALTDLSLRRLGTALGTPARTAPVTPSRPREPGSGRAAGPAVAWRGRLRTRLREAVPWS